MFSSPFEDCFINSYSTMSVQYESVQCSSAATVLDYAEYFLTSSSLLGSSAALLGSLFYYATSCLFVYVYALSRIFYSESSIAALSFNSLCNMSRAWISDAAFPMISSNYNFILFSICILLPCYYVRISISTHDKISSKLCTVLYDVVHNRLILPYLGEKGSRYFSYFFFLFLFVFLGNLLGLIPSVFSITSNLSIVLFLSSISWVSILMVGL